MPFGPEAWKVIVCVASFAPRPEAQDAQYVPRLFQPIIGVIEHMKTLHGLAEECDVSPQGDVHGIFNKTFGQFCAQARLVVRHQRIGSLAA